MKLDEVHTNHSQNVTVRFVESGIEVRTVIRISKKNIQYATKVHNWFKREIKLIPNAIIRAEAHNKSTLLVIIAKVEGNSYALHDTIRKSNALLMLASRRIKQEKLIDEVVKLQYHLKTMK
jgi:hypothetical protein